MKPPQGSSLPPGTQVVTDQAQAAVIANRLEFRRLAPFMRAECTVTQAAQTLGLKVPATFKLVQRYLKLGLLQETHREKRPGRATRYYRAPPAFFVPFSLRPFELIGEQNRAAQLQVFERNLSRAMRESLGVHWGLLTCFLPSGETYHDLVSMQGEVFDPLAAQSPRILSGWNRLVLTEEEAREVQRRLQEIVVPYLHREASGDTYQVGIFMARDSTHSSG